jgi:predicted XRE-type DNA-binding protein
MIAVLTGDVINSAGHPPESWLVDLKFLLGSLGSNPEDWEIYRGDEFQVRLNASKALETAIRIKAQLKCRKGLDVRIGIGLGEESYRAAKVSESNGPAYQASGGVFDRLRDEKLHLQLSSGNTAADTGMNLMLKLASDFMDDWSPVSAEAVLKVLQSPGVSQEQMACELGIQQSAVSQRLSRARLDLLEELLSYYTDQYLKSIR